MREDQLSALARTFLPEGVMVSHVTTCQGRDH